MSYDITDYEREEFYDKIGEELYPEHKDQAISEFTEERLQSFYLSNSFVMRPAVEAIQEGKQLQENKHHSAAQVFFMSAVEILLKATLLRPVIYGLIHNDGLAEIIVENTLSQSGFSRYQKLLASIFKEHAGIELSSVMRDSSENALFRECTTLQKIRNKIIHQGSTCSAEEAEITRLVAVTVYEDIVRPVLHSIGLSIVEQGEIVAV